MDNILILSAGRRVELVQAFQAEIQRALLTGMVMVTDMRPTLSAACQVADKAIKSPRVDSEGYIDFLFEQCLVNSVKLVVPTIDTELLLLAQHRERFAAVGVAVVISDLDLVSLCRDKRKTTELFGAIGFDTPVMIPRDEIKFPVFAKPFDGSSSIGAVAIYDRTMLSDALLNNDKILFTELIDESWTEFTVDAYFDRHGALKCLVPRQRIEVRGGEVSKGITRRNQVYDYVLTKLSNLRGARGCVTLQLFAAPDGNSCSAIELNPRFGGGYPLSYSAGANYPGWLIKEYILNQEVLFFDAWKADLLMLRYDAKVLIENASQLI